MSTASISTVYISHQAALGLLGCSRDVLRKLIRDGSIEAMNLPGARPRVSLESVKALADRCRSGVDAQAS